MTMYEESQTLMVDEFLEAVRAEIARARDLFPGDELQTLAFNEEVGELNKAILDESPAAVRKEAIQVACMAARIVLDGDSSVVEWRKRRGLDPLI